MKENTCPLCGFIAETQHSSTQLDDTLVMCKKCGNFLINESILTSYDSSADLVKLKNNSDTYGLNPQIAVERCNVIYEFLLRKPLYPLNGKNYRYRFFYDQSSIGQYPLEPYFINVAGLMKSYPKNIGEKLDKILLNFALLFPTPGYYIDYDNILVLTKSAMYVESDNYESARDEKQAYIDYLSELGYFNKRSLKLTAKAWARIAELTNKQKEISQGFIAMQFPNEKQPEEMRKDLESISSWFKKTINACGFAPRIMSEIEHNNQIVPEIFFEIEQSKFIVVDITYQNYGAYYEAGYAQALGKQVIICCRKTEFDDPNKKPHFDISQKSMIVWANEDELREKLIKRIEATVGINK